MGCPALAFFLFVGAFRHLVSVLLCGNNRGKTLFFDGFFYTKKIKKSDFFA